MITTETRQLRDLWYKPFASCKPEHNLFHAEHCPACQKLIQAASIKEALALVEIYKLERAAEGLHPAK